MLEVKDNVSFPCHRCLHKTVCSLIGKMEQTKVYLQDNRFGAVIECEEFVPILDENNNNSVIWNETKEEEQA